MLDKDTIAILEDENVIDIVVKRVEQRINKLGEKKSRIRNNDEFYLTNPTYLSVRSTRFELLDLLTEFRTLQKNIQQSELELSSASDDC
jgi:hypothetical protein